MIIDFQSHIFPERYMETMERRDGAVILEEPDPYSGMAYPLRQGPGLPHQPRRSSRAATSSSGWSTWTARAWTCRW